MHRQVWEDCFDSKELFVREVPKFPGSIYKVYSHVSQLLVYTFLPTALLDEFLFLSRS
jgi:hypothetical protein